jgi:choline dehydrogenase-like flavoprotein
VTKILGNASLAKFDVVILGSGCAGSAVADILTRAGQTVLILEAGANRFDFLDDPNRTPVSRHACDEIKNKRGFIYPDPRVEPRTFRNSPADGDRKIVGDVNGLPKTVGGGGVHADLKMPRFEPQDFHLGTELGDVAGASFQDWPVDYDVLEPFYAYVDTAMGIQGDAKADPRAGPRSTPFPMKPGLPMYVAERIKPALDQLGYTRFPFPTAVNSMPFDGRPACQDCGFCSGFGCSTNAKGSPAVTTLRKALLTGKCQLRSETRAVKIVLDASGTSVDHIDCLDPNGARVSVKGDRYVLAMSAIEDARLCLLSKVGSDAVGRFLTFHFQTVAAGIFEKERLHGYRGRTVTHGISDFRGDATDVTNHPLAGVVELSGSDGPVAEASQYARVLKTLGAVSGPRFDGALFKKLMRQSPLRERVIVMALQAEDAPQATNRVDLDPAIADVDGIAAPRITYQNHDFELSARDFYQPKMLEILETAGARWIVSLPADEISGSAHIMGTLRMGTDPTTTVVDATGRFHGVGNLYAADGSTFPTASGFNPTMTIVAMAAYVAGGIASPGHPERALPPPVP